MTTAFQVAWYKKNDGLDWSRMQKLFICTLELLVDNKDKADRDLNDLRNMHPDAFMANRNKQSVGQFVCKYIVKQLNTAKVNEWEIIAKNLLPPEHQQKVDFSNWHNGDIGVCIAKNGDSNQEYKIRVSKPVLILLCFLFQCIDRSEVKLWRKLEEWDLLKDLKRKRRSSMSVCISSDSNKIVEAWLLSTRAGLGMEAANGSNLGKLHFLGRALNKTYFFNWALHHNPMCNIFIPCSLNNTIIDDVSQLKKTLYRKYRNEIDSFVRGGN